jgi:hypothetical protein
MTAEENSKWVRDRIETNGWSDRVEQEARIRWVKNHASVNYIRGQFDVIMRVSGFTC